MPDPGLLSSAIAQRIHQRYFIHVVGTPLAVPLDIASFELREALGDTYRIVIIATHPELLTGEDFVSKDAMFKITRDEGEDTRLWSGCVTHFNRVSRSKDQWTYQLVVEPHVARMRLTRAFRTFQNQDAPGIIESLLRKHGLRGHQFLFKLRRRYPVHAFRLQYGVSDWAYLRQLLEQEGMYCYIEQGKYGDVFVCADDVDHYVYLPKLRLPYREESGQNASEEAITDLQVCSQAVQRAFKVAEFNPAAAWERITAEANLAWKDPTTYGTSYSYGTGHLDQAQAKWEAQLRHEAALAQQLKITGHGHSSEVRPARVVRTDTDIPEAPHGLVITEVTHTGGRSNAYRNAFKAIPCDRRFRLPIDENQWPKVSGTLSGRITSPGNYPYAFLTEAGHYVVRLDLDFDPWNPGGECVPLPLAKPFAGKRQTGMHFPALDGDYAVIECRDGDPNKPYIAAFHHTSIHPDLITNQDRRMSRNRLATQSGAFQEIEDWKGEEHFMLSTPHSGISQLNLGHIVDLRRQKRGEGFELRTDAYGAVRAGGGLLLSTDKQGNAVGAQREMTAAMQVLQTELANAQSLAEQAAQAKAEIADLKAQNAWLRQSVSELKESVMLLSSAKGVAVATPDQVAVTAGKDMNLSTGGGFGVNAMRSIILAAEKAVSLFAHTLGAKIMAARGKVEIQAQSDAMDLSAQQDITVTSMSGKLIFRAKEAIEFYVGGTLMSLEPHRIRQITPGDFYERAAAFDRREPDNSTTKAQLPWTSDIQTQNRHGSKFSG